MSLQWEPATSPAGAGKVGAQHEIGNLLPQMLPRGFGNEQGAR
jgi:hypothetical protein